MQENAKREKPFQNFLRKTGDQIRLFLVYILLNEKVNRWIAAWKDIRKWKSASWNIFDSSLAGPTDLASKKEMLIKMLVHFKLLN